MLLQYYANINGYKPPFITTRLLTLFTNLIFEFLVIDSKDKWTNDVA